MTIEINANRTRPTEIGSDAAVSFEVRPGQELVGTRGTLWVTQDGDPRDVFVQPGQRFVFDRRGVTVIHALHGAGAFLLAGTPVRHPNALASIAAAIDAVRTWFGKPAPQRTPRGRLAQTLT